MILVSIWIWINVFEMRLMKTKINDPDAEFGESQIYYNSNFNYFTGLWPFKSILKWPI